MKHGRSLLVVGMIIGLWLAVAPADEPQVQSPADTEATLPADYDAPPPEMHPDRWPGPAETPATEPAVSEQSEKDVLEFLQKHMTYYYDRLMELKQRDEKAYRRALEYLEKKVKQLQAMPEAIRDAQIRNANVQVDILRAAKGYHEAKSDDERNTLKDNLQKLLSEKFDIEQKVCEYRLQRLDEKLQLSKTRLQQRVNDREKLLAEELRCWLQPPAEPGNETQPTTQPAEPKNTPTTQPTSAPAEEPAAPPTSQPA